MEPHPFNDYSTTGCTRFTIKREDAHVSLHVHKRKAKLVLLKSPSTSYKNLTSLWQEVCQTADENKWVLHYRIPKHETSKLVWTVLREVGFVQSPTEDERYLFRPNRKINT